VRQAIFISHATPEDNDFVRWLGAKLELVGYRVWYDLNRLKGGDYFWDKVEAVIRNDSFRFVAVVSHTSIKKQGVKDEWSVAAAVERGVSGFVVPVKIDDLPFSELPITLHRKNVINFDAGWYDGLINLIDTLVDAGTPKDSNPDPALIRQWLPANAADSVVRTTSNESLDSSWLKIVSLPPSIETARIRGFARNISETQANRQIPWFEHGDRIVGFAKSQELIAVMAESVMLESSNSVDTRSFVEEGQPLGMNSVPWWEARKRVGHLVRQAWELALEKRGFASVFMAGGRRIFFATPELTGGRGKFVTYKDFDGRTRRKALTGKSERRNACWAYGVGMVPSFDDPWRIELKAAVIFTDEAGVPIADAGKAHRLRRGFCKNWWNEQWRTLTRAFLAVAAEGREEFVLPVGTNRAIVLAAVPIQFESPVGLSDFEATGDIEDVESVYEASADEDVDYEEDSDVAGDVGEEVP
jgi:hypothetical protein